MSNRAWWDRNLKGEFINYSPAQVVSTAEINLNIKANRFANRPRGSHRWPLPAATLTGIFLLAAFTFGGPTARAEPTLREWAQRRDFYIGAAVSIPHLNEPEYQATLRREFNLCVPENAATLAALVATLEG